jgi:ATP-dependent helicase HrpA
VTICAEALRISSRVRQLLAGVDPESGLSVDLSYQMDNIIFDRFLSVIPPVWLTRVPVWLRGAEMRLHSAATDPRRDPPRMAQMTPVLDAYSQLIEAHPAPNESIDRIGYLIEEFRLQVFAQSLRTIETVSAKRILKAIADIA